MLGTAQFPNTSTSDVVMGVSALDPPLVQQTKSEIRTLASEMAKLAHAEIPPAEFYSGFLPRLCMAMGAEAAAVWQTEASWLAGHGLASTPQNSRDSDSRDSAKAAEFEMRLVANHSLPRVLYDHDPLDPSVERPANVHGRVLQCVMAEGQPILVPPSTMHIENQRPSNPLDDSLIIVPVRVQKDIEYLLQVVQPPSGGPAAQRGYLRFVAQMADLMCDYLRRQALREHTQRARNLQDFEFWLSAIAQATTAKQRRQLVADGMAELLRSQQVFLLRSGKRSKVLTLSNLASFDPRSETALAAQATENKLNASSDLSELPHTINELSSHTQLRKPIEQLGELLASKRIIRAPLASTGIVAYLAFHDLKESVGETVQLNRVTAAFAGLLNSSSSAAPTALAWLWGQSSLKTNRQLNRSASQRWTMRLILVALVAIIAMFPVPQQISTTAVLAPVHKQMYYAPGIRSATVQEVNVEEGEFVAIDQRLLRLADSELENDTRRLHGQREQIEKEIKQLKDERNRATLPAKSGSTSPMSSNDSELEILESRLGELVEEIEILNAEKRELTIVAKQAGQIASWDVKNRLTNRPVNSGDLLLSTYDIDGPWQLQISIPEHYAGLIMDAMKTAKESGLRIRFSLNSHPGQQYEGELTKLAEQTTQTSEGDNVVLATAIVDSKSLPIKKEGALAWATIHCGFVPAGWLIVRDAYWACSSRIQMLW